uniref:Uncharacterized protein n=1 Tax=Rhizophora mucronata TaxID=61149 RepID=A0A2P2LVK3_RHIMU
MLDLFYSTQIL